MDCRGISGRLTTWAKILCKNKLQITEKKVQAQKRLKYTQNHDCGEVQQNTHKVE